MMRLFYIIGFLSYFLPSMAFAPTQEGLNTAKLALKAYQRDIELIAMNLSFGQQVPRETHLRERREFIRQGIESDANPSKEILDDMRTDLNFKAKVEEAQGKVAGNRLKVNLHDLEIKCIMMRSSNEIL
jgi:hypothetical protein